MFGLLVHLHFCKCEGPLTNIRCPCLSLSLCIYIFFSFFLFLIFFKGRNHELGRRKGIFIVLLSCYTFLPCEQGVRPPSASFLFYPALHLQMSASPSRLLGVLDPLLPVGILRTCLAAYTGANVDEFIEDNPLLSPLSAADDLLRRYVWNAGLKSKKRGE